MTNHSKSKIMQRANALRKTYSMSKSESLRKAWLTVKLDTVRGEKFMLNTKDLFSDDDFAKLDKLNSTITALETALYPRVTQTGRTKLSSFEVKCMESTMSMVASVRGRDSAEYIKMAKSLDADGWLTYEYETIDRNIYDEALLLPETAKPLTDIKISIDDTANTAMESA